MGLNVVSETSGWIVIPPIAKGYLIGANTPGFVNVGALMMPVVESKYKSEHKSITSLL